MLPDIYSTRSQPSEVASWPCWASGNALLTPRKAEAGVHSTWLAEAVTSGVPP